MASSLLHSSPLPAALCRKCSIGATGFPNNNPTNAPFPPVSLAAFGSSFSKSFSGPNSRGESSLELEALAAVQQLAVAVQSIAVSEMLPRTPELIFVNLTTLEGQPYCLELTGKGWRVTSLRSDCMQGDFTRMELFTRYYHSLYELMEDISPSYRDYFATNWLNCDNAKFIERLSLLQGTACNAEGGSDEGYGDNNNGTPPINDTSSQLGNGFSHNLKQSQNGYHTNGNVVEEVDEEELPDVPSPSSLSRQQFSSHMPSNGAETAIACAEPS